MSSRKKSKGLTLIELAIALAIVGILATVAVPSYSNYVKEQKLSEVPTIAALAKSKIEQLWSPNPTTGRTFAVDCGSAAAGSSFWDVSCAGGDSQNVAVDITGKGDMTGFSFTEFVCNNQASLADGGCEKPVGTTKITSRFPEGWPGAPEKTCEDTPSKKARYIIKKGGDC